jgi:hypothetical protein
LSLAPLVSAAAPSRYNTSDIKIPLSCTESLEIEDLINAKLALKGLDDAVLCEAVKKKNVNYCDDVDPSHERVGKTCRKNYRRVELSASIRNPADLFNACSDYFDNGPGRQPLPQKELICQTMVKAMGEQNVDYFCSNGPSVPGVPRDDSACKRDFGFISGPRGCPPNESRGGGVRCSDLARILVAARARNAGQCGGSELCLAAVAPGPRSCVAITHRVVAAFCSANIAKDIKNIAIENAFRRRYGFPPYGQGQYFVTHSVLIPENKLRRSLDLPAFHMGDPLISSMTPTDRNKYIGTLKRGKTSP